MDDQMGLPGMDQPADVTRLPWRIRAMHLSYGERLGERCKTCGHLYAKRWGQRYYKCDLNQDTNGPATDWRVGWPACGKWEPKEKKNRER